MLVLLFFELALDLRLDPPEIELLFVSSLGILAEEETDRLRFLVLPVERLSEENLELFREPETASQASVLVRDA